MALYRLYHEAGNSALVATDRNPHPDILDNFREGEAPSLETITSQICTASQFQEAAYRGWCKAAKSFVRLHRKQWEYVYIFEALRQSNAIRPGARGVGFGCGTEPTVALLAAQGCRILATDLPPEQAAGFGWIETNQHADSKQSLNQDNLCSAREFAQNVEFRHVDMNHIPHDIRGFDFAWSSCALEHLGTLEAGFDFIRNSLCCLRPGGVAVHTTEINLSSNDATIFGGRTAIYRRSDIESFVARCAEDGIAVAPLNWNAVSQPLDEVVDEEPYGKMPHLKLRFGGFVSTSIGLLFRVPH